FTEGPLYHPDGFYYFVDVRESKFYRIKPGEKAELLRDNSGEGNSTTLDPQGRLIQCEGGNRRVTRWPADGTFASGDVLMDRFDGKRLTAAKLDALKWRCIGPPRGGGVVAVAGDPKARGVFYFGACAGGV